MRFRQLLPEPGEVRIEDLLEDLDLPALASPNRPVVLGNFVASVDGHISFQGRSGQLGDDGDLETFRALRRVSDAVLVGTSTAGAEQYGRVLRNPESRERRRARGLSPEPLAVMLTRRGDLPLGIPLFAEPEARVVVFSGADVDLSDAAAQVEVVRLEPPHLTFAAALEDLRRRHDIRVLLCEGGAAVLGALVREGLLDMLFLTLAPALTGGGGPTVTTGPELPQLARLELAGMLERAGSLYLRYVVRHET